MDFFLFLSMVEDVILYNTVMYNKSSVIDPYKEVTSWPDGEVAVTPKSGSSGGEMSPPTVA